MRNLLLGWIMVAVHITGFAAKDRLEGVWSGMVGVDTVYVCFGDLQGNFYRLKDRRGVILDFEGVPKSTEKAGPGNTYSLSEGGIAKWNVTLIDARVLNGVRHPTNSKQRDQRIHLIRGRAPTKNVGQIGECAHEFYRPLIQGTPIKVEHREFDGYLLKKISSQYGSTFALPGDDFSVSQINDRNRAWLDAQVVNAYNCMWAVPTGTTWSKVAQTPIAWRHNLLVVRTVQDHQYCGGGHGDSYAREEVIDLRSGKVIDTWRWVRGGRKATGSFDEPMTSFRMLLNRFGEKVRVSKSVDGGFLKVDQQEFYAGPYPTEKGLVFPTRLVACYHPDCDVQITIPYAALGKFLTAEGRQALATFTGKGKTDNALATTSNIEDVLPER